MKRNVILIFDIGKTNKKYFLFDECFNELESSYVQITEITDDDGDPCDDLASITKWMLSIIEKIKLNEAYKICFINFSAYGATMVHLDKKGEPCTPLYNYLKAFPAEIKMLFEEKHGDIKLWSKQTASPWLGMLNAGLQLFWIKYQKPHLFEQIHKTLFLPQYLSYVLTGTAITEFTSIGCHTGLWDFAKNNFHEWVYKEELIRLFPSIVSSYTAHKKNIDFTKTGVGIHDSSSALVPYIQKKLEPFMLLSTGTWSICLNPFNNQPLTKEELDADCLCYMQPNGSQVKASRYFLGNIFTQCEKIIAKHFGKLQSYHHSVKFDRKLRGNAIAMEKNIFIDNSSGLSLHSEDEPNDYFGGFANYEAAYHQLIKELVQVQAYKIRLIHSNGINSLFIDGGFARNEVFLETLKVSLRDFTITASDVALGSSLGAAMVVSHGINEKVY